MKKVLKSSVLAYMKTLVFGAEDEDGNVWGYKYEELWYELEAWLKGGGE